MKQNIKGDLLLHLMKENMNGNISDEGAHSIIQVASGKAGLFKESGLNVKDIEGNPLVTGKIYELQVGHLGVRQCFITGDQFGSGNMCDTYYHVFYTYANEGKLSNGQTCIEGKGDIFSGFTYHSGFKLIVEKTKD